MHIIPIIIPLGGQAYVIVAVIVAVLFDSVYFGRSPPNSHSVARAT